MIIEQSKQIVAEVGKAFIGKDEIVEKVLMTIYAGGHVLVQDCPGVGKTTLALAFSRVLGLDQKRIQFTTDTMPSDITGFTIFNRETNQFEYQEGAANCQLLLADEINRTSPKTQSALLEAMEEHHVTVDGITHALPAPFVCIATQNPIGSAGTQPLPESQLDRFMVRLSMGYPDREQEINILKARAAGSPIGLVENVVNEQQILALQAQSERVYIHDAIYDYIVRLVQATRRHEFVELGVSPRGTLAVAAMAKAYALYEDRDYCIPADVKEVFFDVVGHRLVLGSRAAREMVSERDVVVQILESTAAPRLKKGKA